MLPPRWPRRGLAPPEGLLAAARAGAAVRLAAPLVALALLLAPGVLDAAEGVGAEDSDKPDAVAVHPRLLFGPGDIDILRQRITRSPHKEMFERLVADRDHGDWGRPGPGSRPEYDQACIAHRAAFLYVLTGDDTHALRAREMVEALIHDRDWGNRRARGLGLYFLGRSVALAYDWCHGAPSWDAEFTAQVSAKLLEQGHAIFEAGGSSQNPSPASNWQGIRWSVAGLCYLATDEPLEDKDRRLEQCFRRVSLYLRENLGPGEGSGWNCEGLGYTYFPMGGSVVPFGIAIHRRDPAMDIRAATPGAPYALWTTYAATVRNAEGELMRPDFSDDNPHANGEGSLGFAFWMTPPELHPGLVWWYDRMVGVRGDGTYDNARLGTIASILSHPGDTVAERDPLEIPEWRRLFIDRGGNGLQTWRNAYQDHNDVVVQLHAKLRRTGGHDGPDALSFRIAGLNGLWATGGGRYGPKTNGQDVYWRSQNTLYPVHPDERLANNKTECRIVGEPVVHADGSGSATVAGTNNFGVRDLTRRFAVDFDPATGAHAAIVICDTSDNGRFWQLATSDLHEVEAGSGAFTITAPDGAVMAGTVLHPQDADITTGTRPRGSGAFGRDHNHFVVVESDDGCFTIVLTLVKPGQSPPEVTGEGNWTGNPAGAITIGRARFKVDGDAIETAPR